MAKQRSNKPSIPEPPFQPIPCPACGSIDMRLGQTVSITKQEIADDAGWIVAGRLKLFRCMHGQCGNCGYLVEAIRQEIPTSYPNLACPKCSHTSFMKYAVNKFDLESNPPSFTARVSCTHCGKKSVLSRLISKLNVWAIKEVEFSFPGTKIKVGKSAA